MIDSDMVVTGDIGSVVAFVLLAIILIGGVSLWKKRNK